MEKKNTKFGIIDIIILVFIIAAAAVLIFRFTSKGTTFSANNKTINYSLKVEGVRGFTFDYYEIGAKCFDKQTNKYIGKIVGKRQEQFYDIPETQLGSVKSFPKPGIIAIYLDIEATGSETDTALIAEGTYEIKAGSEVFLTTNKIEVISRVMNAEIK